MLWKDWIISSLLLVAISYFGGILTMFQCQRDAERGYREYLEKQKESEFLKGQK